MFIREISLDSAETDKKKYPFSLSNISSLSHSKIKLRSNVVFFVGENGSGKTTLLEAIAEAMGTGRYGGSKDFIKDESRKSQLSSNILIGRDTYPQDVFFFRAESFFNLQNDLDRYARHPGEKFHMQYTGSERNFREFSHGQGFKLFFQNRVRKNGLYLMDEPESALSPQSQMELLFLLKEFENMGCQMIIATHSPILLSYPNAQILSFDYDKVTELDYEDTQPFIATKGFLDNYKRYQKEIDEM